MTTPVTVAIVGSGPAGCYLAQSLRRGLPDADITIYDRLVSPFGLVRYGVAPDHQSTKSIQAQFARLFERENIRFAGNIDVGVDVTLEDLRRTHNIVVMAAGLWQDRRVGVPGEDLPQVYGAGRLTRLFNAHPLEPQELPHFGSSVGIIGGGNVSIDIVRLLIKRPEDFIGSDINDAALAEYAKSPVRRIELICRSSVANAPSDPVMLAELGRVPGVRFSCSDLIDVGEEASRTAVARSKALKALLEIDPGHSVRVEVALHFGWAPVSILGEESVHGVELRSVDGRAPLQQLPVDSVVTAVGFDFYEKDWHGLGALSASPESGALAPGLYRTGWIKRGSRGTIAENRACAKAVAEEILTDLATAEMQQTSGYAGLPDQVRARAIDYSAWKRVEAAESKAAAEGRTRRKFPSHEHMMAIARDDVIDGAAHHRGDAVVTTAKEER